MIENASDLAQIQHQLQRQKVVQETSLANILASSRTMLADGIPPPRSRWSSTSATVLDLVLLSVTYGTESVSDEDGIEGVDLWKLILQSAFHDKLCALLQKSLTDSSVKLKASILDHCDRMTAVPQACELSQKVAATVSHFSQDLGCLWNDTVHSSDRAMLQRMLTRESSIMLLQLSNWMRAQVEGADEGAGAGAGAGIGAGTAERRMAKNLFFARLAWSLTRHMPILRMIFNVRATTSAAPVPVGEGGIPTPPSVEAIRAAFDQESHLSALKELGCGGVTSALQTLEIPNHSAVAIVRSLNTEETAAPTSSINHATDMPSYNHPVASLSFQEFDFLFKASFLECHVLGTVGDTTGAALQRREQRQRVQVHSRACWASAQHMFTLTTECALDAWARWSSDILCGNLKQWLLTSHFLNPKLDDNKSYVVSDQQWRNVFGQGWIQTSLSEEAESGELVEESIWLPSLASPPVFSFAMSLCAELCRATGTGSNFQTQAPRSPSSTTHRSFAAADPPFGWLLLGKGDSGEIQSHISTHNSKTAAKVPAGSAAAVVDPAFLEAVHPIYARDRLIPQAMLGAIKVIREVLVDGTTLTGGARYDADPFHQGSGYLLKTSLESPVLQVIFDLTFLQKTLSTSARRGHLETANPRAGSNIWGFEVGSIFQSSTHKTSVGTATTFRDAAAHMQDLLLTLENRIDPVDWELYSPKLAELNGSFCGNCGTLFAALNPGGRQAREQAMLLSSSGSMATHESMQMSKPIARFSVLPVSALQILPEPKKGRQPLAKTPVKKTAESGSGSRSTAGANIRETMVDVNKKTLEKLQSVRSLGKNVVSDASSLGANLLSQASTFLADTSGQEDGDSAYLESSLF